MLHIALRQQNFEPRSHFHLDPAGGTARDMFVAALVPTFPDWSMGRMQLFASPGSIDLGLVGSTTTTMECSRDGVFIVNGCGRARPRQHGRLSEQHARGLGQQIADTAPEPGMVSFAPYRSGSAFVMDKT
jgi:hypothetical protein